MSPIQQMLLGVGAVATKTYVDDIFSTYLYNGTSVSNSGPAQTINNGIDVSGKGGLVWIKTRNGGLSHCLFDTVRGKTKRIKTNSSGAEDTDSAYLADFKTNGFEVGDDSSTNGNSGTFASWTFRKSPGFFDVVTYTGTGSKRTVSHNLGCQPGMIAVKRTDGTGDWEVWHKALGGTGSDFYWVRLNSTMAASTTSTRFGDWPADSPTSTAFTVGTAGDTNGSGSSYVAYLFAGGESTAATAVSVDFNGSSQYLSIPDSTDYEFGSGDFTVECWLKADSFGNKNGLVSKHYGGYSSWRILTDGSGASSTFKFIWMDSNGNENTVTGGTVERGQWTHVAVSRSGNTIRMFVNGLSNGNVSFNNTIRDGDTAVLIGTEYIGSSHANQYYFDGKISNVRIVKGTGVYTSSFKPSTTALTSITNTKLLCCQSSTVTTATTSTGSITNNGAAASTDSPFDDPAGFVFGDAGDQNVIKCGSYVGNGSSTGPEIFLGDGWEPQWLLIKNTADSENWFMYDSMRGIVTGGDDANLKPNNTDAEGDHERLELTSTGFKLTDGDGNLNGNGDTHVFVALRRPDGYVGKPPELGTGVFTVVNSATDGNSPWMRTPNHIVDYQFFKLRTSTDNWWTSSRLTQGKYLYIDTTAAEAANQYQQFDYMDGYNSGIETSGNYTSWLWKRHAGFDVVTFVGNQTSNHQIRHSLNAVPEMMWLKSRGGSEDWAVYHKGLDGGTNPETHYLLLNSTDAEADGEMFSDTAPTSTHFTVGNFGESNDNNENMIAMLFASVDGISKCGFYDGSNSSQTISTGFAPRFVIIKNATASNNNWITFDTTRGWGSGNDKSLFINTDEAEDSLGSYDWGAPTSTGFTLTSTNSLYNSSGDKFIYYAHA